MLRPKIFPFQLKLGMKMPFGQWSIELFSRIVMRCMMHIDKVNLITAHNYGKLKRHPFSPKFNAWKGKFWASTLSHKMCPRKHCKLVWTKIADLGIVFLRWSYLIHWYQLLHPHIVGSMSCRFFCCHLYSRYTPVLLLAIDQHLSNIEHNFVGNFQLLYLI